MPAGWKKTWSVRSYPDAVRSILKRLPQVYGDGTRDAVIGWVGRTFAHQRRDVKPKVPQLTVDREERLVFQHDLVTPFTYTVTLQQEDFGTTVRIEVRPSAMAKDTGPADQVVALAYALTKALEPLDE